MNNIINDDLIEKPIYKSNLICHDNQIISNVNELVDKNNIIFKDIEILPNFINNNIEKKEINYDNISEIDTIDKIFTYQKIIFRDKIDPIIITDSFIDYYKKKNFMCYPHLSKYNFSCLVTDDNYNKYNSQYGNNDIKNTASVVFQIFKNNNKKQYIVVLRMLYGDRITFNNQCRIIFKNFYNPKNKLYKYIIS